MNGVKVLGAIVPTIALSIGAIAFSADGVKAQSVEAVYIQSIKNTLEDNGYQHLASTLDSYDAQTGTIRVGYAVCDALDDGYSMHYVVSELLAGSLTERAVTNFGTDAIAYLVGTEIGAAIPLFCPRHQATSDQYFGQASRQSQPASYYSPSTVSHSCPIVLRSDTNIRSGPSATSTVIGNESTMLLDTIQVHSTETGRDGYQWSWIGFQGSDGRTAGWVRSDFINRDTCD